MTFNSFFFDIMHKTHILLSKGGGEVKMKRYQMTTHLELIAPPPGDNSLYAPGLLYKLE